VEGSGSKGGSGRGHAAEACADAATDGTCTEEDDQIRRRYFVVMDVVMGEVVHGVVAVDKGSLQKDRVDNEEELEDARQLQHCKDQQAMEEGVEVAGQAWFPFAASCLLAASLPR
jgi:hypothetical protein